MDWPVLTSKKSCMVTHHQIGLHLPHINKNERNPSIDQLIIYINILYLLTILPNVSRYGLRLPAPEIESLNNRFERVVIRLVDWIILDIRLVVDLLVVCGVPRGCLLIVWVSGWDRRRSHDVCPPFLGVLLGR